MVKLGLGGVDAMLIRLYLGGPNGSMLTHTNLLTQSVMLAIMQDVSAKTVYLACGPLFHVATFMTSSARP